MPAADPAAAGEQHLKLRKAKLLVVEKIGSAPVEEYSKSLYNQKTTVQNDINLELHVIPRRAESLNFLEIKTIVPQYVENITEMLTDFETDSTPDLPPDISPDLSPDLLPVYFARWRSAVGKKPKNDKINSFLDNLRRFQESKPPEVKVRSVRKPKCFENRFRAQKNIIEQQKAQLREQKRIIEELRLNRIHEEAVRNVKIAATEYRRIASSSTKSKHKAKPENEETILRLQSGTAPKIVQQMEERAQERFERRLLIKERKRLLDEERKKLAEEAVQRKLKEESDEKDKRLQQLKEHQEQIREAEHRRRAERTKYWELHKRATKHAGEKLAKKSFYLIKLNVRRTRIRCEIARTFYENNVITLAFKAWERSTAETTLKKQRSADAMCNQKCLRRHLDVWKQAHTQTVVNAQVAVDYREKSLQNRTFVAFHRLVCRYHVENHAKMVRAVRHHNRFVLFQCLHHWRTLPDITHIEKVRNERKKKWRMRVAEVLDDYDPQKNYDL